MKCLRQPALLAILVLVLTAPLAAAADKVDDVVNAELQRQRIPGASVAVVRDGKVVKAEGYGLANVELKIPATSDTVYQIGSVSKQLIAAGIMLLVQDGKVALDDRISKYLTGTPQTWQAITVRHLLTHTSGLLREAPGFDPYKIQNDADVIGTAYQSPMLFAPGEKWEYSNVGYFALGEIIRVASGEAWESFLQKRLFQPLGMSATRTTTFADIVPNRANGYALRNNALVNAQLFVALRPSGAFLSTVLDLVKWDAALNATELLTAATRSQMWAPVALNGGGSHPYGFGWSIDAAAGRTRVHHGGSMPGFRAALHRYIDDRLTVIVLTNSGSGAPDTIARAVAETYIPGITPPPPAAAPAASPAAPQRTAVKVDPSLFDAYVGEYQPNSSVTVTVWREGDKLMLEASNPAIKTELLPESESSFFSNAIPFTITFAKDATGTVTHLVLMNNGAVAGRAQKVK